MASSPRQDSEANQGLADMWLPVQVRRVVMARADYRCEYCRAPMEAIGYSLQIDHIIPRAVGGVHSLNNLALACPSCNHAKYTKVMATDPRTHKRVRLFNPRTQRWAAHFRWNRDYTKIYGRTDVGRATVSALKMNNAWQQRARLIWRMAGLIP